MADVKWIKIMTDVFDNRKIKQIETMPEGDAILVVWFKLLTMAGKVNDGGLIYLTENIPYTEEMLSTQFGKPLSIVRLALATFQQFGMIERDEQQIFISSWEKYQSTDRMAEIREYNRLAQRKSREKRRLLSPVNDMSMTSQRCHETDIEEEVDIEVDKKIDKKPTRHKHGEYKNVLLSDDDLEKWKTERPGDWSERIEAMSAYMASTGKPYKNHLATLRNWARKDGGQARVYKSPEEVDW